MQESPKPFSPARQVAHVIGYRALATGCVSILGAIATAMAGGPVHTVFGVVALASPVVMLVAIVVHGPDMLRCRRCMHQTAQALGDAAPTDAEQPVPDTAEPESSQAWWAA